VGVVPAAHVVIVGGGWSGCAAAVTLARAGVRVTLLEQARVLGGRARRVAQDGIALDNGQHLLVGANRQSLDLIAEVHGQQQMAALFKRLPLTLRPFGDAPPSAVALTAWPLPAPLNLAGAMLAARGLNWRERIALLTGFRRLARAKFQVPKGQTVSQCFAGAPLHVMESVWEPLCIAALNTPPEAASAQHFANVLRETFAGGARASDMLVPVADLSALFPEAAARFVSERGGNVRMGVAVRSIARAANRIDVATGSGTESCDAVIVAVGPHQLAATLGPTCDEGWRDPVAAVAAFDYESITTVYLGHARPLPMPLPLMRLDDAPGQWIFDRNAAPRAALPGGARGLVAVVISTGGPHNALDHATLASQIDAQLQRRYRTLAPLAWSRVIAERRATYACTPALARPSAGRVDDGVYLAGDYTDPDFPATLEAATRSGVRAASALLRDLRVTAAAPRAA
jgi:squalene-associated FAD-dependent desaturase